MATFHMGKNRKYLFIAGALVLLIGVVYRLLPLWDHIGAAGDRIAVKEKQISTYRQVLQQGGNLEGELKALEQRIKSAETGLLTGQTASIAAADIQSVVRDMATKSNVEIKTVRVLKPEALEKGDYLSIPVQLTITSDIGPLAHFLYRVETSPKHLTVKTLRIRVAPARAKTISSPPQAVILSDLTVHGIMKKAQD
jgi:hypothetical protein